MSVISQKTETVIWHVCVMNNLKRVIWSSVKIVNGPFAVNVSWTVWGPVCDICLSTGELSSCLCNYYNRRCTTCLWFGWSSRLISRHFFLLFCDIVMNSWEKILETNTIEGCLCQIWDVYRLVSSLRCFWHRKYPHPQRLVHSEQTIDVYMYLNMIKNIYGSLIVLNVIH